MPLSASLIRSQNIAITDLNPHYVWGGDAITLAGKRKQESSDLSAYS
jgi:hypothetical protein